METSLISGEKAVQRRASKRRTRGRLQPVPHKRDSPSVTVEPEEAEEERMLPDSDPENTNNVCTLCSFLAKCPRSLKIHYTRKHGRNTVKGNNVGLDEIQPDVDMETESDVHQNQESGVLRRRSAASVKTSSLKKKQMESDKQQEAEDDVTPYSVTHQRRVSKRTPKPKMIFSCNYCGQEFRDKTPLDVHVQRCHTKDTPYTCEYLWYIIIHIRVIYKALLKHRLTKVLNISNI